MDANLLVVLGKEVSFSGQGLKTNLSGKVNIKKTGEKIQMHGKIALKNARFRAYGQDLSVQRGEILFNGPVDNPWLDIEATRLSKSKDVTAILRVTGPVKDPQTRIFINTASTRNRGACLPFDRSSPQPSEQIRGEYDRQRRT